MSLPVAPITDDLSREWFAAAADGVLLIQRCGACGAAQWYPRRHCHRCFGAEVEWQPAAGTGVLHAHSVVRHTPNAEFAALVPYVLALVDLDEGVRMTTRLVDAAETDLRAGMPVRAVFPPAGDGIVLPLFTGGWE